MGSLRTPHETPQLWQITNVWRTYGIKFYPDIVRHPGHEDKNVFVEILNKY